MKIGQKIYFKPINNAARGSRDIIETTVSKIGRKYFECEGMWSIKFFIDTLGDNSGQYCSSYKGYLSKQDILDEEESEKILRILQKEFDRFTSNLNLDQLRRINDIINEGGV